MLLEATVQISVAGALRPDDSKSRLQDMTRGRTNFEAAKTWRPLTPEEQCKAKEVIHVVILPTEKRGGAFKARACVKGNLVNTHGLDEYAPLVAMPAHCYLLTPAAAEGDYVKGFDIDCAFLNADLNEEVYASLPKVCQQEGRAGVKRLVKALYGLPQSPRAWFKRLEAFLKKVGWEQCLCEPGLWRKCSNVKIGHFVKMSVYVDDIFVAGPEKTEVETLV